MTKTIYIGLFLFLASPLWAQPKDKEVLEAELANKPSGERLVDIYADLSYNYVWSDAGKALNFAEMGIELADSIGYAFGRAKCLSEAGLCLLYQGYGPESLEYLFEANEEIEKHDDSFWNFTTLSSIGYVYWELNEPEQSIENFKKAKKYADAMGIENFDISILSDIGETYIKINQVDSGLHYVGKAYGIALSSRDTFQIAVTGNQMAILYRMSNDLNNSLHYSKQSLPYSIAAGWNPRRSCLNVAEIFSVQNELDSSIQYANECVFFANQGSFVDEHLLRAHTLLTNAYAEKGLSDSVIAHMQKQIEINSIIASSEKTKRIQGIVFDREMNENKIAQAKKDAEMAAKLERQGFLKTVGFIIAAVVLIFSIVLFNRMRVILKQKKEIQKEKERGDNLLLNILPKKIAEELKEKGRVNAVRFEEVAVLFTDFQDFTKLSAKMTAVELVKEIDVCFSAFDNIIYRNGLEKIKTIGDSYMAASGIPVPDTGFLQNVVNAGHEILEFMSERNSKLKKDGKHTFEIRVGIHCGPAVAGVVGVKKFAYDIWGDTVNIASRMESNSEAGRINISKSVYERIKDTDDLVFIDRESVEVKGKGEMQMYFVDKKDNLLKVV